MITHIIETLRTEIERQGLTYRDIERMTGIPDSTVQRMLTGHVADPSFERIAAICRAVNISVDALIGIESKDSETIQTLLREKDLLLARVGAAEAQQKLLEPQGQYAVRAREESREAYEYRINISKDRVIWQRKVVFFLGALVVGLLSLVAVMSMWHMLH